MSRSSVQLRWEFQHGLYFAHTPEGLWTIEQLRKRFYVTLTLAGSRGRDVQIMGDYPKLETAKKHVARDHQTLTTESR